MASRKNPSKMSAGFGRFGKSQPSTLLSGVERSIESDFFFEERARFATPGGDRVGNSCLCLIWR